jgi:DNA-binding GntR family transcriptional regulator
VGEMTMLNIDLPRDGSRRTAHELVRDTLRRAILRGTLPGGLRLVQAEIAAQLEVSTTPVREALRDLATEGLIRLDAHRGAIVRELDYSEVEEIYDLRKLLEPEALRRAAENITEEELEHAASLQAQMDGVTDAGVWADLNREFHATLVRAARAPRLINILQNLRDSAAPYVGLSLQASEEQRRLANDQHREILEAMRAGDADKAIAIALEHLESTRQILADRGMASEEVASARSRR